MEHDRSSHVALRVSVAFLVASLVWFAAVGLVVVPLTDTRPAGWAHLVALGAFVVAVTVALFVFLRRHLEVEEELHRQQVHQAELEASFFRGSPEAMWVYDPETLELVEVNDAMVKRYGRSRELLLSLRLPDLSPPTDDAVVSRIVNRLPDQGDPHVWLLVDGDGSTRWIEVTSNSIVLDGRPLRLAVGRDVTVQRATEEALRASERRLAGVLASMQEVAFSIDLASRRITYLNDVATDLLGGPNDGEPMPLAELEAMVLAEDRAALRAAFDDVVARGWADVEVRIETPTAGERIVGIRGRAVLGDDGRVGQIDGVVVDLTRRAELEELVAHQRSFDQLTGLPVRTAFLSAVDASLASAHHTTPRPVLAMFDLDRFADVNESAGHSAGDALLAAVAQRMDAVLEPGMLVARVGGDEFALFCPGGMASSSDIGTRLRRAVEGPFLVDDYEFWVSMSVGLAEAEPGDTAEDLIRDAHLAMSAAKARITGIELFEPMHRSLALDRVRLEGDLRRALAEGLLFSVFQPEVDLRTRRIVAVEALVRWHHPSRGLVPAAEFVGEAERSSLVVELGEVMIDQAFRQAALWEQRYGDAAPVVWVNLSRREVDDPAVVDRVLAAIERTGVSAEKVGLEITETAFVADIDEANRVLTRFADAGVALALDDFGTGWSSLTSLRAFPVSAVKIDQSFVANVDVEVGDRQIVAAIVGMAQGLSLQTVAEGVETPRQMEVLAGLGVDVGQGYLFGRPNSAAVIDGLLEAGGVPLGLPDDPMPAVLGDDGRQ